LESWRILFIIPNLKDTPAATARKINSRHNSTVS